ncbi:MAG: luciferase-like protein, partial [Hyphomicrobiales bacterium]|nr:luciferase-like protein [Hyphomicrobiales bacterium]
SREMFMDAYQCLRKGMVSDELTYEGAYYNYKDAPIELHTYQPSPAFWYGSSNTVGAAFAGEAGMHFTANGPTDFAKKNIDAYKEALAKRGGPEIVKPEFSGGAAIGALRQIFVAETDAEAIAIAEPAAMKHHEEINWLRNKHGVNELTARLNVPRSHDLAGMMKEGTVIAGSPSTVLAEIQRQTEVLGTNYILAYMMFGNLTLEQSMRSLNLFNAEVMPTIRAM